ERDTTRVLVILLEFTGDRGPIREADRLLAFEYGHVGFTDCSRNGPAPLSYAINGICDGMTALREIGNDPVQDHGSALLHVLISRCNRDTKLRKHKIAIR